MVRKWGLSTPQAPKPSTQWSGVASDVAVWVSSVAQRRVGCPARCDVRQPHRISLYFCPKSPKTKSLEDRTFGNMSLTSTKIAFIGGGNMGAAIISGLLATGISPSNITVSEPFDAARAKVSALGVQTTTSNIDAAANADIVVIAVKPQVMRGVCTELGRAWASRSSLPTVLSIAAGITLGSLSEWLKTSGDRVAHIVRVMPNTPALVGEGATGAVAGPGVTEEEKKLVGTLLESISNATEWVASEELLDVVTGLSGSYFVSQDRGDRATLTFIRIWTCVFLQDGGTPCCERSCARSTSGSGNPTRCPDLPWSWQNAGHIVRKPGTVTQKRH